MAMHWIVWSLVAPVFSTATNFADKYLLKDRIPDPLVMSLFVAFVSFLAGIVAWILFGFQTISSSDALLMIIAGIISYFSWVYYLKGLADEETSSVIILLQISPVFTLLLSGLFLSESISIVQLVGFILILAASTYVSVSGQSDSEDTHSGKNGSIPRSFWDINMANILWSVSAVILKSGLNDYSLTQVLPYEGWGLGVGAIILLALYPPLIKTLQTELKVMKFTTFLYMGLNELCALASRWITIGAYSLGPVALVDVVVGIQVFYGILTGAILTTMFPRIFDENLERNHIWIKVYACCVLLLGLYLIQ